MDIVTQGLLGAVMSASAAKKDELRRAAFIGGAAAMLADIDVLIRSAEDSLLNLEFHRHFSHALIFIPVGALLAAALLWPWLRKRLKFRRIYLYALLGYATSGLLDACTSYGTHLLWPFSDTRIAWSIIAIIDPLFSLLLIIALMLAWRHGRSGNARIGLLCAGIYLSFGWWQHQQAEQAAWQLAAERGHNASAVIVKPTLANLLLWRSIYEFEAVFHVDAIRVGPVAGTRVYRGESAAKFDPDRDRPALSQDSLLYHDIERFVYFSNGYVIADPARENVLIDIRYSMLPTRLNPMWGIDLKHSTPGQHARFVVYRERPDGLRRQFIAMLLGRDLSEEQ